MKPMFCRSLTAGSLSDTLYLCSQNRDVVASLVCGTQSEFDDLAGALYRMKIDGVYCKDYILDSHEFTLWFNNNSRLRVWIQSELEHQYAKRAHFYLFTNSINEHTYRIITQSLMAYTMPDDDKALNEFLDSFTIHHT